MSGPLIESLFIIGGGLNTRAASNMHNIVYCINILRVLMHLLQGAFEYLSRKAIVQSIHLAIAHVLSSIKA